MPNDDTQYDVAADEVRQFIEVAEQFAADRASIAEQEKEHWAEAKARGLDVPTMKKVIALRKMDPEKRQEAEMLLDTYKTAVGLE